ncbi:MAG: DUF6668 family protein [Propioniciclava sp.]
MRLPDGLSALPVAQQPMAAPLWWLGVHGGAAESSLAALVPDWAAAEHQWPTPPGEERARVVLTARSNMRGLEAAQAAATQWAAGGLPHIDLLGLVVVADAPGQLPRPLREFAQLVAGGVPRMWTIGWIEAWRMGETPELTDAPRNVRALIDELHTLTHPGATSTT